MTFDLQQISMPSSNWAYVVSLKYSPVHRTLSRAFGESLRARGWHVHYLWSRRYDAQGDAEHVTFCTTSDSAASIVRDTLWFFIATWWHVWKLFHRQRPVLLYFNNPHPLNVAVIALARLAQRDVLAISVIHEPYKDDKQAYGRTKAFYIALVEWSQTLAIRASDAIVVPSRTAERAFRARYGQKCRVRVVPLLFEDVAKPCGEPRRYVTFLGHAVKVKGITRYFALLEESVRRGLDLDFQIATSSDIQAYLQALTPAARARLRVVNAPTLSDEQMAEAAASSICVLALYETVMQSAVVPLAWMNGAPVLATDLDGLTEFVTHGETGWIVPRDATDDQLFDALAQIRAHLDGMTVNCRRAYEQTFDQRNWSRHYAWLSERQTVAHETTAAIVSHG